MKKKSVSFRKLLFVSLFLIIVVISASFSCNYQEDDYCTNPDSVIASEINKRKIVLLGESPHHDFIMYNGLINILHNWVQNCEKDRSREFVLNLVLEIDSTEASYIDNYIKTGNDSMLYHKVVPYQNFEDFEFFSNLRKITIKIDGLNNNRNNRIVFNVLGFEDTFENNEAYLRKNQQESERWFVNERDKNVSLKLIEFIKNHNNEHFLLNYGAAHIQSGYVNKNLGFSIPDEETYGYYLLHYLKQEFGEDSVMSFVQAIYIDKVLDDSFLKKYSNKDVLIHSDNFPIKTVIHEDNLFVVIRYFTRPFRKYDPHLFPMVFSRFIVEKLSEKSQYLVKYLPGYKPKLFYIRYLQHIFYITGEKLDNDIKSKVWLKTNAEFNGLERIDSKEYASFIFGLLKESKEYSREKLLNDLGFSSEDLTPYSKDSTYWFENWKTINRKAKFINAIGIYWIGYPDEKVSAKKYLIEFTGEDHSEPQEYLKWLRKKYFNYEK